MCHLLTCNDVLIGSTLLHSSIRIVASWRQWQKCPKPFHIWLLTQFGLIVILRSLHILATQRRALHAPRSQIFLPLDGTPRQQLISLIILTVFFPVVFAASIWGTLWFLEIVRSDELSNICLPELEITNDAWFIAALIAFSYIWLLFYVSFVAKMLSTWGSDAGVATWLRNGLFAGWCLRREIARYAPIIKVTSANQYLLSNRRAQAGLQQPLLSPFDEAGEDNLISRLPPQYYGDPMLSRSAFYSCYQTCTICIDEIREGSRIRKLPCGHCFHYLCVDRWFLQGEDHLRCPNCQTDLRLGF